MQVQPALDSLLTLLWSAVICYWFAEEQRSDWPGRPFAAQRLPSLLALSAATVPGSLAFAPGAWINSSTWDTPLHILTVIQFFKELVAPQLKYWGGEICFIPSFFYPPHYIVPQGRNGLQWPVHQCDHRVHVSLLNEGELPRYKGLSYFPSHWISNDWCSTWALNE